MERPSKFQIIVSPKAMQMLVTHAGFLAQVNETAALRLTEAFEDTARSLEEMPQRFPWFSGAFIPPHKYRFALFEKRYMLLYQVTEDTVYIDYS